MELLLKNKLPRGTLLPHLFIHPSLMVSLNGTIILYISPFDDFTFNIMNTENFWTIFIELLLVEIEGTSIHKSSKFWHGHSVSYKQVLPKTNLLNYFACLRAHISTCLTCWRAHVPTCLACFCAQVVQGLTCSPANVPTCSRAITSNNKNKFSMMFPWIFGTFFLSFS